MPPPIDGGTNEADDDSDVGQAIARGDSPSPLRCRLPAVLVGIGVIDRDLEVFDGCSKIISAGDAPSFVQVLGVPTPTCHGMLERRLQHPVQATELTAHGTVNETHDDQLPIRGEGQWSSREWNRRWGWESQSWKDRCCWAR